MVSFLGFKSNWKFLDGVEMGMKLELIFMEEKWFLKILHQQKIMRL